MGAKAGSQKQPNGEEAFRGKGSGSAPPEK